MLKSPENIQNGLLHSSKPYLRQSAHGLQREVQRTTVSVYINLLQHFVEAECETELTAVLTEWKPERSVDTTALQE